MQRNDCNARGSDKNLQLVNRGCSTVSAQGAQPGNAQDIMKRVKAMQEAQG